MIFEGYQGRRKEKARMRRSSAGDGGRGGGQEDGTMGIEPMPLRLLSQCFTNEAKLAIVGSGRKPSAFQHPSREGEGNKHNGPAKDRQSAREWPASAQDKGRGKGRGAERIAARVGRASCRDTWRVMCVDLAAFSHWSKQFIAHRSWSRHERFRCCHR